MEKIARLRGIVEDAIEETRNSPEYRDAELQWQMIEPGWGVEEGPADELTDAFVERMMLLLRHLLGTIAGAAEELRLSEDPHVAMRFRHSAVMAVAASLPALARFLATERMHGLLSDQIGGRQVPGSFEAWLEERLDMEGPYAELAHTALADPEWPEGSMGVVEYMERLVEIQAPAHLLILLGQAWSDYARDEGLDLDGEPLDDRLSPEMFHGASSVLADVRSASEDDLWALAEELGVPDADENGIEEACLVRWFQLQWQLGKARASALSTRFQVAVDFLEENRETLRAEGLAWDNDEETIEFDPALMEVLSAVSLDDLPWTEDDAGLDYAGVIAIRRALKGSIE